MSVLHCNNCSALIDTDYDVEAYSPKLDEWWCPPCRANWRGWDDEEEEPDPLEAYDLYHGGLQQRKEIVE